MSDHRLPFKFKPALSSWIAHRFKLSGKGSGTSKTGVVIAITGVAIAVMVMEFTLCIVMGFKSQIRAKLTGFESQITIGPRYIDNNGTVDDTIQLTDRWREQLRQVAPEGTVSLAFRQPAILKTPDDFSAVVLTGHDNGHDYSFERSMLSEGQWPDFTLDSTANHIVLSATTASQLKLGIGDKIDASFFVNDEVKSRRYKLVGIYRSNITAYDGTIGFASLRSLQRVAGIDSCYGNAIELSGLPLDSIEPAAERISNHIMAEYYNGINPDIYPVNTVINKGSMYFSWLSLLDTNVAVIFILMLCVAGFTLVSSLFILVLEHVPAIGILRTLGASRGRVRTVFQLMAMRLAAAGLLAGNILGISLMYLQYKYKVIPLDPQMYYLDHVPVEFNCTGLILLNIGIAAAVWLILLIPASAAARTDPSRVVNYE